MSDIKFETYMIFVVLVLFFLLVAFVSRAPFTTSLIMRLHRITRLVLVFLVVPAVPLLRPKDWEVS